MATNISKVSGVIFVTDGTNQPKSYFGANGSYTVWDDLLGVRITIRSGINNPDTYNLALSDITVNGQTPANITTLKVLLNAVFGS